MCAQRLSASKGTSLFTPRLLLHFKKCSTPVGIEGNITARQQTPAPAPKGAQRLSASKGTSQPGNKLPRLRQKVLNACRHRREHHLAKRNKVVNDKKCSTPVGIEGNITGGNMPRETLIEGAQRLSASKGTSPYTIYGTAISPMCSTPVGIEGNITQMKIYVASSWRKCSTPVGIEGNITRGQSTFPDIGFSAQRLSASKGTSQMFCCTNLSFSRVLNACRHRREHHAAHARCLGGIEHVLNACRHRREHHPLQAGQRTSTPCVLNACRHRREHHPLISLLLLCRMPCSTPVGIEGNITRTKISRQHALGRAQRLSASKGTSPLSAKPLAATDVIPGEIKHQ